MKKIINKRFFITATRVNRQTLGETRETKQYALKDTRDIIHRGMVRAGHYKDIVVGETLEAV